MFDFNFKNPELLKQALLHRSYLNEHPEIKLEHNERLEFLGDAVLELVTTDYLFHKYPNRQEGELTAFRAALVNAETLSDVASKLGVNEHLLLSKGEAKDNGRARQNILANTFESIIGALYLDQGYEAAKIFITKHLLPLTDEIVAKNLWQDSKSLFQEKAQELVDVTPSYRVLSEIGPDHEKIFTVGVYLNNDLVAEGKGPSKQRAEQEAARAGLKAKHWN
jgi:ribonuclease-3